MSPLARSKRALLTCCGNLGLGRRREAAMARPDQSPPPRKPHRGPSQGVGWSIGAMGRESWRKGIARGLFLPLLLALFACRGQISPAPPSRPAALRPSEPARTLEPAAQKALVPSPQSHPTASPESSLGVRDAGVFSDLDERVQIQLPADATPERVTATVDSARALL